jgi:NADH-quinone oxidoreductase subunit G
VPRRNPDINKSWICDDGRLSYERYNLTERTRGASIAGEQATFEEAYAKIAELVGGGTGAGKGVAVLASTSDTCEELHALKAWADKAGIKHLWHGAEGWEADDFLKEADATPNTAGAKALGFTPVPTEAPELRGLIVAGEVDVPPALLASLDFLVLQAPVGGELAAAAMVLLPGLTRVEKQGTWVNSAGMAQAIKPALEPGPGVAEDWQLWRDLGGGDWETLKALTRDCRAVLDGSTVLGSTGAPTVVSES